MSKALRRTARTLLQFVAAGGLTALVAALADGLDPVVTALVLAGGQALVAWAQNTLEELNVIPVLLPTTDLTRPGSLGLVEPRRAA